MGPIVVVVVTTTMVTLSYFALRDYKLQCNSRMNGPNQKTAPEHKPIWGWHQLVMHWWGCAGIKNNKASQRWIIAWVLSETIVGGQWAVLAQVVISGKVSRMVFVSSPRLCVVITSPFSSWADPHSSKVTVDSWYSIWKHSFSSPIHVLIYTVDHSILQYFPSGGRLQYKH